ncbi:MAG: hypothetical protein AAF387_19215 [Pseudomonadota bacterium]
MDFISPAYRYRFIKARIISIALFWFFPQLALAQDPEALSQIATRFNLPTWVSQLRGEITIKAQEISVDRNILTNITLPISLENKELSVTGAEFSSADGKARVDFSIDKHTAEFVGVIRAENFVLNTVNARPADKPLDARQKLFMDEVLLPDWLPRLVGELHFDVAQGTWQTTSYKELEGTLTFNQQSLSSAIKVVIDSGYAEGSFVHDHHSHRSKITVLGQRIPVQIFSITDEYVSDLPVNIDLDIVTEGQTARTMASTANGKLLLETGTGNLNIQKLDKLTKDILSLTLTSLLPISLGPAHAKLECGAIKLKLENGVALSDNSIAVRLDTLAVMGGGEINFANETLDLALHPHARHAGRINTKSAVKELTLAGPFDDIKITPHLGGILDQSLSLTGKIASLGLAKIGLPILDWAAPPDVACMSTLEMAHEAQN